MMQTYVHVRLPLHRVLGPRRTHGRVKVIRSGFFPSLPQMQMNYFYCGN